MKMKRMKKTRSKITLSLFHHKTVLYTRLECRKSLFGQIAVCIISIRSGTASDYGFPLGSFAWLSVMLGARHREEGDS
jgi:hypothetical protein